MKHISRSSLVIGSLGLALVASSGCSDDSAQQFGGFGNNGSIGMSGAPSTGGAPGTAGAGTAGSPSAGAPPATAGAPGTSGASSQAGTPSTGGATGGSGGSSGGSGGTTAGSGGSTAGTNAGGQVGDFPAGCPAATAPHTGTAFARSCFSITASSCAATSGNMNPPGNAIDGMDGTRWSTGAVMSSSKQFTFTIDLGSAVMVSGISTTATKKDPDDGTYDTPPEIAVSTSVDGTTFTPVACGDSAVEGIDVGFAPTNAKFVRVVQHGVKTGNWWTIKELNVYGSGTTCASGTSTHMCTTSVN